ncbi:nickel insertion protein [Lederbergia sp. NSJ-179]|uniref:nickel insertion protein n=1 Tax=Lederbergia sp. NSJ-179 TaxID=2931402 RepID=UPI0024548CE3|nr:nickel insertion protein [Lederbergia sp. NSJ-179]
MDDMTGEALGFTMEKLLGAGALDVYHTPIYMKKNRPGILLTTLAPTELESALTDILLEETTTLGVRSYPSTRTILDRKIVNTNTPYGRIRIKQAIKHGHVIRALPEYEDVKQAALEHNLPFQEVYKAALTFGNK